MPKKLTDLELRNVLDVWEGAAEPLSIGAIHERLGDAPSRRTLQRWLAALVEAGRFRAHGQRRGRQYSLPSANNEGMPVSRSPWFPASL